MNKDKKNRYENPSASNEHRFKGAWNTFKEFLRSLDVRTWAVIGMMLVVLTAMMGLNATAWGKFLPPWIAYTLSIFMEVGALAWKFADERPHNSDDQQTLTRFLVWMNVILATFLMVVNLIRSELYAESISVTGWDFTAFGFVAVSALGHIGGALMFRQFDERLANKRKIARQYSRSEYEELAAKGILDDAMRRLEGREKIAERLQEARERFANLPKNELDAILQDVKDALEVEYNLDFDNDGKIGKGIQPPTSQKTAHAMNSDTKQSFPTPPPED